MTLIVSSWFLRSNELVGSSKMIYDVYGVTADIVEDEHGLNVRAYDSDEDSMADRS
ncbi:MAG: hypothetical protein J5897_01165 [Candidatus Methanomethylophilus sp.]|nr:hypothetical protein [Methanomethylophilus sp.]